jgi:hypothetical protein
MTEDSVQITVTATTRSDDGHDQRHVLTLDSPRASWSLPELHELAYSAADAAGLLSEITTTVAVEIRCADGHLQIP